LTNLPVQAKGKMCHLENVSVYCFNELMLTNVSREWVGSVTLL
jgi:hypothetical protein